MGRHRIRGKSDVGDRGAGPIKSGSPSDVLDGLFTFSLKFYDVSNPKFRCDGRTDHYFQALLDRLKALSQEEVSTLTARKADQARRFHRVDFAKPNVSEGGFGIPKWEQYEGDAWQFAVCSNEHGRVHGFLIENTFYVVWLDPDHKLHPGG